MKICILSMVNIKHMSLINHYTQIMDDMYIEYDIIYVDKYNEEEYISAKNKYVYNIKIKETDNIIKKLIKYFGFNKYAKNIMKNENYDLIIVWGTSTAILLFDYLIWTYKNKYILNIRDYAFEKNRILFKMVSLLTKKSELNTISSEGFLDFLPKEKYVMLHSYNDIILNQLAPRKEKRALDEPIRITFIGYVRFIETDKKILDIFANDDRFIIQYFGSRANRLKDYCIKNDIKNVKFHDRFNVEDTALFLEQADVINNLYGYGNIALDTAISIKYYYALYLNIPILVYENTYMETITEQIGIGFSTRYIDENFKNKFYNWYHSINIEELSQKTAEELRKIEKEKEKFVKLFKKIIIN